MTKLGTLGCMWHCQVSRKSCRLLSLYSLLIFFFLPGFENCTSVQKVNINRQWTPSFGGFLQWGFPKNGWFIVEKGWFGGTPILGKPHLEKNVNFDFPQHLPQVLWLKQRREISFSTLAQSKRFLLQLDFRLSNLLRGHVESSVLALALWKSLILRDPFDVGKICPKTPQSCVGKKDVWSFCLLNHRKLGHACSLNSGYWSPTSWKPMILVHLVRRSCVSKSWHGAKVGKAWATATAQGNDDDWWLLLWWLMMDDSSSSSSSPSPSRITHHSSVISHQSSVISHQSSIINHQSSIIMMMIIIMIMLMRLTDDEHAIADANADALNITQPIRLSSSTWHVDANLHTLGGAMGNEAGGQPYCKNEDKHNQSTRMETRHNKTTTTSTTALLSSQLPPQHLLNENYCCVAKLSGRVNCLKYNNFLRKASTKVPAGISATLKKRI